MIYGRDDKPIPRTVFEGAGMKGTNIESIKRALEPYVGKPTRIAWDDGTAEVLTIVSVDDEGFVYELIPPDEIRYYWNRHEEVTSVG